MFSRRSKRCACGFCEDDRVTMRSALTHLDGTPVGTVHGIVKPWTGGCHIVVWEETDAVTPLPNSNVRFDKRTLN